MKAVLFLKSPRGNHKKAKRTHNRSLRRRAKAAIRTEE